MIDINPNVFDITNHIYVGYRDSPRYTDDNITISLYDKDTMAVTIISDGYITEFKISQNQNFSHIIVIDVVQQNLTKPGYREETVVTHNTTTKETVETHHQNIFYNLYGLAKHIIKSLIEQGESRK